MNPQNPIRPQGPNSPSGSGPQSARRLLRPRKTYLAAKEIIKYFLGDDKFDASILCQARTNFVTSDQSLYEAIGAFPDKSKIELNKLVKFLEVVEIVSYEQTFRQRKKILTPERAESLMKDINQNKTLKKDNGGNEKDSNKKSNGDKKNNLDKKKGLDKKNDVDKKKDLAFESKNKKVE
ncbi:hypothetical protein HN695_07850 [Candidatus Woesearchaeota archaeon]|jgi:hypothetical protein|nr:hypothetical protein [Candidatus Woesearchaeota archaeon]MBT5272415.1 hypothetical protein [Candidatus Woesearchaeota archaeon]MBT6041243.1 hypothetical protein [Candidatus Woesearchaeota archaeon]MBT6337469.1 hypothetical protein [Candidatus Woesearchaeota archaeon]MBT7928218.1 hypothetical protein [Candidatus Woesearchaeota archaeon]